MRFGTMRSVVAMAVLGLVGSHAMATSVYFDGFDQAGTGPGANYSAFGTAPDVANRTTDGATTVLDFQTTSTNGTNVAKGLQVDGGIDITGAPTQFEIAARFAPLTPTPAADQNAPFTLSVGSGGGTGFNAVFQDFVPRVLLQGNLSGVSDAISNYSAGEYYTYVADVTSAGTTFYLLSPSNSVLYSITNTALTRATYGDALFLRIQQATPGFNDGSETQHAYVDYLSVNTELTAVPEPTAIACLAGCGGLLLCRKRRAS